MALARALNRRMTEARRREISGAQLVTDLLAETPPSSAGTSATTSGVTSLATSVLTEPEQIHVDEVVTEDIRIDTQVTQVTQATEVQVPAEALVEIQPETVIEPAKVPSVSCPKSDTRDSITFQPSAQPAVAPPQPVAPPPRIPGRPSRPRTLSCFTYCFPAIPTTGHVVIDFGDVDISDSPTDVNDVNDVIYIDDLFESDTPFCFGLGIRITKLFQ